MDSEWTTSGGALSDKTARAEYGLTQDEIHDGIRSGHLQFRQNQMHGNPYLRLLRTEVEAYLTILRGADFLERQVLVTKLKSIETQIRGCKSKLRKLEKEKELLESELASRPQ